MSFLGKVALLAALGILTSGCSPSSAPADHTEAGSTAASVASQTSDTTEGAMAGLIPLTLRELSMPRTASSSSCNVEALGETAFRATPLDVTDEVTTVSGWILSTASKKSGVPAQLRILNMAGTAGWQLPITNWVARPDVISAMHAIDSGNVGFSQTVNFKVVQRGQYHVFVVFEDAGQLYSCDKGSLINIR